MDSGVPVMTEFEPVDDLSGMDEPVPLSTEGRTLTSMADGQDMKPLGGSEGERGGRERDHDYSKLQHYDNYLYLVFVIGSCPRP